MRSLIIPALLVLLPAASARADGKTVFTAQGCVKCHSVSAQNITGEGDAPDLSHIGSKRTAEWMQKFLMKEEAIDGKKHKKKFQGTPEELKTLTEWLATLK